MKFSIILTTYNRGDTFLRQSIESVVNQTYNNWELLIYDNYSTDTTDEVVSQFKSSKIKYKKFLNNGIISRSRNLGIYEADGDFTGLIDSDDYWEKDKLLECSNNLKSKNIDGVCHAENWIFPDGNKMIVNYGPEHRFCYTNLLTYGNCLSPSATLIKNQVLRDVGGYSENSEYTTAEDYDLWLKISKKNHKFIFIRDVLGNFRVHAEGLSYDTQNNIEASIAVVKDHCISSSNKTHRPVGNCYFNGAKTFHVRGEYSQALLNYLKSIRHYWFFNRSWIYILILLIPHKILSYLYERRKIKGK